MDIERIAAFSNGSEGGNPAGVVLTDKMLDADVMQKIAADVGYSETAFAFPQDDGSWRVRYFAPSFEVPFCGHATIALGAALAKQHGADTYQLQLNNEQISLTSFQTDDSYSTALKSPKTQIPEDISSDIAAKVYDLFGLSEADINKDIPPAFINAGAKHLVLALKDRSVLAKMSYDFDEGLAFMTQHSLVTIMLVWVENDQLFHARNAFAAGGVVEDPATGAAAAAFTGYLRHMGWPHNNRIKIIQGEDMGLKSIINVELTDEPGSPVTVSGSTYFIK